MKQKSITIVLTVTLILAVLLIAPKITQIHSYVFKMAFLLAGGLFLLILLLVNYKTLTIDKKDVLILIFLGIAFISTFLAKNIKIAIMGMENRFDGLLMLITYICIYICAKKYLDYSNINKIFNLFFYIAMIVSILGILQRHIHYDNLSPLFNKGICSTFGNSNFFGSFISIVLPISMGIFIFNGNKKGFILSLFMFFNMISSGTRSAWVAFVFVAIVGGIYLIKQKNKSYFKRSGILLVCFILIFIYLLNGFGLTKKTTVAQTKIGQITKDITEATQTGISNKMGSGRIEIWKMTLKVIKQKPIFGCGTDNLDDGLRECCYDDYYNFAVRTKGGIDKAHNEYLQIAVTLGIPALFIYLIFVASILWPKLKLLSNKSYFIVFIAITSYLVQAFFNISTIGVAPLFWTLLGLIDNINLMKKFEENI